MTAVANPPSFSNINRPAWSINGGHMLGQMSSDEVRGALMPRKTLNRTNSASSISSSSSTSSTTTVIGNENRQNGAPQSAAGDLSGWPRKRPAPKSQQNGVRPEQGPDTGRAPPQRNGNGMNGGAVTYNPQPVQNAGPVAPPRSAPNGPAPVPSALYLLSLNGTFERKTISVPVFPDTLRIGRQTNAKTVPTANNGYFDSKVLSRAHAEIWSDQQGKIWIRDIKSSNGTFVNGTRLSPENRESEPHELQTGDHLELGIDIVSEDQKQVVHHKVAAKVEHAGFMASNGGLMDVNFGELDPGHSALMMPMGGAAPMRGRAGSNASMGSSGRMSNASGMTGAQSSGAAYNRNWLASNLTTEVIVKRLREEMRSARQQAQDIGRTGKFIDALLSPEDIKGQDKPEAPEPPKPQPLAAAVNGNSTSFRSEPKARFSDPPAPPPQQPLPDKPDVAKTNGDVAGLKRSSTEKPKVASQSSPVRHDNISQIIQLTEAVNLAKHEIDVQSAKIRDLEEMLQKEREMRTAAEEAARRLEDDAHARTNGAVTLPDVPSAEAEKVSQDEHDSSREISSASTDKPQSSEEKDTLAQHFQLRIDHMMQEMRELKEQLDHQKKQTEQVIMERDTDRKSLAEMVSSIRQKDEEAAALKAALKQARARSKSAARGRSTTARSETSKAVGPISQSSATTAPSVGDGTFDDPAEEEPPTLSRANTITPTSRSPAIRPSNVTIQQSLPYASMMGVVLIGMGLMAYLNGWQPPQARVDR